MASTEMDIESGNNERARYVYLLSLLLALLPTSLKETYNGTSTIMKYLKTELPSNDDLKDFTSCCMKLCLGGALYKGVTSQNDNMSVGKEPLMVVAEAATMGGLVACVSCIMCWRNYTRATDIVAKTGCSFTVAAISIMFFLHIHGILAWVIPMLVIGLTIPWIWMA